MRNLISWEWLCEHNKKAGYSCEAHIHTYMIKPFTEIINVTIPNNVCN